MFDNIVGRAGGLAMLSLHFIIHPFQSGDTVLNSFTQSQLTFTNILLNTTISKLHKYIFVKTEHILNHVCNIFLSSQIFLQCLKDYVVKTLYKKGRETVFLTTGQYVY